MIELLVVMLIILLGGMVAFAPGLGGTFSSGWIDDVILFVEGVADPSRRYCGEWPDIASANYAPIDLHPVTGTVSLYWP